MTESSRTYVLATHGVGGVRGRIRAMNAARAAEQVASGLGDMAWDHRPRPRSVCVRRTAVRSPPVTDESCYAAVRRSGQRQRADPRGAISIASGMDLEASAYLCDAA